MTFLLVPHTVEDTAAVIWVGAIDEDTGAQAVKLEYSDNGSTEIIELDASKWQRWQSYTTTDPQSYPPLDRLLNLLLPKSPPILRTLLYQRVEVKSLKPRTSYSLRLLINEPTVGSEEHLWKGQINTLPAALPTEEDKPFTVFLGSCFYGPRDTEGLVGKTYQRVPNSDRPEVKILCGDQVYLDNPWQETTLKYFYGNQKPGLFRAMLFDKYKDNWTQAQGEAAGFRQLLKNGANYFCSDDHEFWNNAPDFGGVGMVNTFSRKQREWWFGEATKLFRAFQSSSALMKFKVDPVSFCIADTRINRNPESQRFMQDADLKAVGEWIEGLEGPGVLVVGQPVLTSGTGVQSRSGKGLLGRVAKSLPHRIKSFSLDRALPDYAEQYEELIGYIKSSRYSIVVLTGDVHFGRVAYGELRLGSEKKFIEIISSPMQAVLSGDGKPLFGSYRDAPTENFPNLRSLKVTDRENNFATVQFSLGKGSEVMMKVKYWSILRSGAEGPPEPKVVFQTTLP